MRRPWILILSSLAALALTTSRAPAQSTLSVGSEIVFGGGLSQAPQSRQIGMSVTIGKVNVANVKDGDGKGEAGAGAEGPATVSASMSSPEEAAKQDPDDPSQPLPDVELPAMESDELIAELTGGPAPHRAAAARRLAGTKDPAARAEAASHLRDALADPDPRVTSVIIGSLVSLGDAGAIPPLRDLVANGEDAVSVAAIQALVTLKDPDLRALLEPLAGSGAGVVSAAAERALRP